ncbi:MAG: hydrogenase maturation nickel metallochaperone HypA [Ignavibacteriae bacterium]|nr:MAG: hydrogenase maturation nickel metallochaperone HypA [Ignavibacteriota bacterium]
MHELSVAQSIVEIIQQHVPRSEWERVAAVRLKIGAIAGVVPESLEFSFQAITAESTMSHARLEIESIPFRIHCHTCLTTAENEIGVAQCSSCGSTDTNIISGSELDVSEIEIADPEAVRP